MDEDVGVAVSDETSDLAHFSDYGTYGSIRPQIHIRPSFEVRQRWYGIDDQTALYTLRVSTGNAICIIQPTVEVRFPGPNTFS